MSASEKIRLFHNKALLNFGAMYLSIPKGMIVTTTYVTHYILIYVPV